MSDQDDDYGVRMTDHANLYNRALTLIKTKGFKLIMVPTPTDDDEYKAMYVAKQGNRDFDAEDPLRLLGMITIWENAGDDWWDNPKFKSESIEELLTDRAYPEDLEEMEEYTEDEFRAYVDDYREFFTLGFFPDIEIKEDISRKEFFDIVTTYWIHSEEDQV